MLPLTATLLRTATVDDAAAIARLHLRSWRHAYRDVLPHAWLDRQREEDHAEAWRARLAAGEGTVLLAERDGAVIGFCACGPSRDAGADPAAVWEIYNLHVAPDLHGSGHGRTLFEAGADLGRARGARLLTLWVVDENAPARGFYERLGMTFDGARQQHPLEGGAALSEVRYRRPL